MLSFMSDNRDRHNMSGPQPELWSIDEVANYLGCSASRARALLASRAISRISGYPAEQVRQIQRRQGHRTDLTPPPEFGPIQEAVLRQLGGVSSGRTLTDTWTADKIAQAIDPSPNGTGMRPLVDSGLTHLHNRGYAEPADPNSWRLTIAGREALTQLPAQDSSKRKEQPDLFTRKRRARNYQRKHGVTYTEAMRAVLNDPEAPTITPPKDSMPSPYEK